MPKLTHYAFCPYSRSIRILLAENALDVTLADELPWAWRPEFLQLNPSGDLPVLELDDGTALSGVYAISEYIGDMARAAPADEPMIDPFPGGPEERAEVRRLVDWFHRKLWRETSRDMIEEKLWARLMPDRPPRAPNAELLRALRSNLRYHLSYVSYLVDQRPWLAGDGLSFADMAAFGHLSIVDYIDEVAWDSYPSARQWYVRMKSRPSVRPLLADRVPGLAPPQHYSDLDF